MNQQYRWLGDAAQQEQPPPSPTASRWAPYDSVSPNARHGDSRVGPRMDIMGAWRIGWAEAERTLAAHPVAHTILMVLLAFAVILVLQRLVRRTVPW